MEVTYITLLFGFGLFTSSLLAGSCNWFTCEYNIVGVGVSSSDIIVLGAGWDTGSGKPVLHMSVVLNAGETVCSKSAPLLPDERGFALDDGLYASWRNVGEIADFKRSDYRLEFTLLDEEGASVGGDFPKQTFNADEVELILWNGWSLDVLWDTPSPLCI